MGLVVVVAPVNITHDPQLRNVLTQYDHIEHAVAVLVVDDVEVDVAVVVVA